MRRRAFDITEDANFEVTFNLNPERWLDNVSDSNNPIFDEANWRPEIKYLNAENTGISDGIKSIPDNTGGVYVFFIKGLCLPFLEKHIVYIGRSHYSGSQNIKKRAMEYINDKRPLIQKMFARWGAYIYYRYYPDTDNTLIDRNEVMLIRAIKPDFNEEIPDRIDVQPVVNAF